MSKILITILTLLVIGLASAGSARAEGCPEVDRLRSAVKTLGSPEHLTHRQAAFAQWAEHQVAVAERVVEGCAR
jgi:hypothetical protein